MGKEGLKKVNLFTDDIKSKCDTIVPRLSTYRKCKLILKKGNILRTNQPHVDSCIHPFILENLENSICYFYRFYLNSKSTHLSRF